MTERPVLFSGPMVRAILVGAKTQTRRILTPQPSGGVRRVQVVVGKPPPALLEDGHGRAVRPRYGMPGDQLWVRETHAIVPRLSGGERTVGDEAVRYQATWDKTHSSRWRPSIHMPRWASRITLEVTEVRVQRLQEITAEDAEAEGIGFDETRCDGECGATPCALARGAFERLWDSINGDRATWASNPWVWALTFRRLP